MDLIGFTKLRIISGKFELIMFAMMAVPFRFIISLQSISHYTMFDRYYNN
jgi:hypothetical protein